MRRPISVLRFWISEGLSQDILVGIILVETLGVIRPLPCLRLRVNLNLDMRDFRLAETRLAQNHLNYINKASKWAGSKWRVTLTRLTHNGLSPGCAIPSDATCD